ncbi:hypothetical protein QAA85_03505, partial [Serratia nevei]|nr:hypothetical protein [Serratia nevei]MDK5701681.1 hypothetical protein [Serratia nevei]MDK5836502.1 hypothetical protein [Serratia nevei]
LLCHGTVCVVGKMRDLILQLSKSSIYSTKPIEPANFTLQLGDRCKNFWRRSSQPLRKPVQPTTRQPERRE